MLQDIDCCRVAALDGMADENDGRGLDSRTATAECYSPRQIPDKLKMFISTNVARLLVKIHPIIGVRFPLMADLG